MQHDQQRRQALRDGARDGDARRREIADDDEEEVQRHVHRTRDGQVDERTLRVTARAEDAVAEVVDRHGGQTQRIDAQIADGAVDELVLRVEHAEHRPGQPRADETDQQPRAGADEKRRVQRPLELFIVAETETASDGDVHARAHADQQSREERDEQRRRADGTEGDIPREFTRDGDVAEVEKHLQHLCQHQRQAEKKNISPEEPCCHFDGTRLGRLVSAHDGFSFS